MCGRLPLAQSQDGWYSVVDEICAGRAVYMPSGRAFDGDGARLTPPVAPVGDAERTGRLGGEQLYL